VRDSAVEKVERRLEVFRIDLLRRDRPELREAEDCVLDMPYGNPQRELSASLRPAGVDGGRREHPAELARDPHCILRCRRNGVGVFHAQIDPHVDVLCAADERSETRGLRASG
jgi:hypothetical protein